MMRFGGDPDELFAKVRDHVDPVMSRLLPRARPSRRTSSRGPTTGSSSVNLWEREEGRQAMAGGAGGAGGVFVAAGMPTAASRGFEVLAPPRRATPTGTAVGPRGELALRGTSARAWRNW